MRKNYPVWIDCEMTGLNPDIHLILEIAVLITDNDLNIVAEGPNIVIHHDDEALSTMDSWSRKQHARSGLLREVRDSTITQARAERDVLAFLRKHCLKGQSPACGNSIDTDRRFLVRHMPRVNDFLHYQSIDVSSIKQLAQRWYPSVKLPVKKDLHRALPDILESIEELRFYRTRVFARNV